MRCAVVSAWRGVAAWRVLRRVCVWRAVQRFFARACPEFQIGYLVTRSRDRSLSLCAVACCCASPDLVPHLLTDRTSRLIRVSSPLVEACRPRHARSRSSRQTRRRSSPRSPRSRWSSRSATRRFHPPEPMARRRPMRGARRWMTPRMRSLQSITRHSRCAASFAYRAFAAAIVLCATG